MARGLVMTACLIGACEPRLYSEDAVGDVGGGAWKQPENQWSLQAPPDSLVSEGMSVGQIVRDVRGKDQFGEEVSLWQFHGSWIVVDIATMWCAPCRDLAIGTEHVWQTWRDRNVIYLTVLLEDTEGNAPNQEELANWALFATLDEQHDYERITAPIISDPKGRSGSIEAIQGGQYPAVLLIDPELRVHRRIEPVTEARIVETLEELDLR